MAAIESGGSEERSALDRNKESSSTVANGKAYVWVQILKFPLFTRPFFLKDFKWSLQPK